MPMATQIKLLRVLESGEITRVGSNTPLKVNVRILSATNRNLEEAIVSGEFRSDLYHRLKVVTIAIPTLQERAGDIPLLIEHFVKQFAKRHGKTIKGMSVAARVKLGSYPWPGNVRQLRNVIESMVVVDCDETLDVDDLPLELEPSSGAAAAPAAVDMQSGLAALVGRPLEEVERIFITETLKLTGGNREQAAELLRIGERTLYRKIKEYQLT
jgi:two-component system response regulator HydG